MASLSPSSSSSSSQRLFPVPFTCSKPYQSLPVVLSCRFSPNFSTCVPPLFFINTTCYGQNRCSHLFASRICTQQTLEIPALSVSETVSEDQLWAAACLRVQSFYEFNQSFGIEDHKRYLSEHEFEALKDRISGRRIGFKRVACINATIPLSEMSSSSDDFCSKCKFSENGEVRVVVGTLDLNQSVRLADEISGKRPEGIGADFARAYLSNVCVAKELHRNGVGYALVAKSKKVAQEWDHLSITDLYAHVAVDNEAARKLYKKSGFIYENDEPAWQARFLGRPRRILLWADLTCK